MSNSHSLIYISIRADDASTLSCITGNPISTLFILIELVSNVCSCLHAERSISVLNMSRLKPPSCRHTSQLECYWHQVLCCLRHDELAHLCAAGKGHLHKQGFNQRDQQLIGCLLWIVATILDSLMIICLAYTMQSTISNSKCGCRIRSQSHGSTAPDRYTAAHRSTALAYLVDAGMLCKRCPSHWPITRNDVDHAWRDASLDCQLTHPQCAQWRLFCHLPHAQLQHQQTSMCWNAYRHAKPTPL